MVAEAKPARDLRAEMAKELRQDRQAAAADTACDFGDSVSV